MARRCPRKRFAQAEYCLRRAETFLGNNAAERRFVGAALIEAAIVIGAWVPWLVVTGHDKLS